MFENVHLGSNEILILKIRKKFSPEKVILWYFLFYVELFFFVVVVWMQ